MRTRTRLAATMLAAGLVLGVASVASAQTTTTVAQGESKAGAAEGEHVIHLGVSPEQLKKDSYANYEILHCIEEQAPKASPDFVKCSNAPSPILPAPNELIWGTLAFAILLGFMAWKGYPAMKKGMEGRTERIRAELARAEEARTEAETMLAEYQQQVASSKGEATRIIEDARSTAEATKAELHRRAEAEVAEMKARAAADIESAKAQAISDLKGQVATLAIGAAEVVVQKSLDPATQTALIDNYINQVTASSN